MRHWKEHTSFSRYGWQIVLTCNASTNLLSQSFALRLSWNCFQRECWLAQHSYLQSQSNSLGFEGYKKTVERDQHKGVVWIGSWKCSRCNTPFRLQLLFASSTPSGPSSLFIYRSNLSFLKELIKEYFR